LKKEQEAIIEYEYIKR